jgi:hypothetical protein
MGGSGVGAEPVDRILREEAAVTGGIVFPASQSVE